MKRSSEVGLKFQSTAKTGFSFAQSSLSPEDVAKVMTVSYTHLDVYKRQVLDLLIARQQSCCLQHGFQRFHIAPLRFEHRAEHFPAETLPRVALGLCAGEGFSLALVTGVE